MLKNNKDKMSSNKDFLEKLEFVGRSKEKYEFFPSEVYGTSEDAILTKAVDKKTKNEYVGKIFLKRDLSSKKEINAYSKIGDSPYAVKLIDYHKDGQTPFLILEKMDGDLSDIKESFPQFVDILQQAILGMNDLHSKGVAHNKIIAQNIFFKIRDDGGYKIKFGNFGSYYKLTPHFLAKDVEDLTRFFFIRLISSERFKTEGIRSSRSYYEIDKLLSKTHQTMEDLYRNLQEIRLKYFM